MAENLPAQTKQAIATLSDPKASKADKLVAVGDPIVSSAMIAGLSAIKGKSAKSGITPETPPPVEPPAPPAPEATVEPKPLVEPPLTAPEHISVGSRLSKKLVSINHQEAVKRFNQGEDVYYQTADDNEMARVSGKNLDYELEEGGVYSVLPKEKAQSPATAKVGEVKQAEGKAIERMTPEEARKERCWNICK